MLGITALGVATTGRGGSSTAWLGFGIAFAVFFALAALMRYADFRLAGSGRKIPATVTTVGVGLGTSVGFLLVRVLGAGARLVVFGAVGGFLIGAAVFYSVLPAGAEAQGSAASGAESLGPAGPRWGRGRTQ